MSAYIRITCKHCARTADLAREGEFCSNLCRSRYHNAQRAAVESERAELLKQFAELGAFANSEAFQALARRAATLAA